MSIVNPPPNFTETIFRSTVRTFAQGSAAQRAAAARAAQTAATAASLEALGSSLFAIHIGSLLTQLVLGQQHQLVQQLATQLQLDQQQRTRVNTQCILDPTVLTLCPGTGTHTFEEVRDGLQEIRDGLNAVYLRLRLVPSLPTWRPFMRWWLYEFTRAFNRMESIVEQGFICRPEQERVCRKRVPGIKRVCVMKIPLSMLGE